MKVFLFFCTAVIFVFATSSFATSYSGSYDVGGGANNFSNPKAAIDSLRTAGNSMTGNVVLNVYNGTYTQGVLSLYAISGLGTYNLTIQNAPGQNPVVNITSGLAVFDINRGENITISGMRTTSHFGDAHNQCADWPCLSYQAYSDPWRYSQSNHATRQ
jgi:hypothetical protein